MSIDPLAGSMPGSSPYSYAANNPVCLVDVDGLAPGGKNKDGQGEASKDNSSSGSWTRTEANGDLSMKRAIDTITITAVRDSSSKKSSKDSIPTQFSLGTSNLELRVSDATGNVSPPVQAQGLDYVWRTTGSKASDKVRLGWVRNGLDYNRSIAVSCGDGGYAKEGYTIDGETYPSYTWAAPDTYREPEGQERTWEEVEDDWGAWLWDADDESPKNWSERLAYDLENEPEMRNFFEAMSHRAAAGMPLGFGNNLNRSQRKAINSLQKRIAEHEQKLSDYMKDPDKFDHLNILKNAPSDEIRQRIIQSRINHLQKEIDTFRENIQKIINGQ